MLVPPCGTTLRLGSASGAGANTVARDECNFYAVCPPPWAHGEKVAHLRHKVRVRKGLSRFHDRAKSLYTCGEATDA